MYIGSYAKCDFNNLIDDEVVLPLEQKIIDRKLYVYSKYFDGGTSFDVTDNSELRLDFSLMVEVLLKFNNLYESQIYTLSQYGKVEVHFGILNLPK